jgi:hypothetical protein
MLGLKPSSLNEMKGDDWYDEMWAICYIIQIGE